MPCTLSQRARTFLLSDGVKLAKKELRSKNKKSRDDRMDGNDYNQRVQSVSAKCLRVSERKTEILKSKTREMRVVKWN